jgi:hypothetical protein
VAFLEIIRRAPNLKEPGIFPLGRSFSEHREVSKAARTVYTKKIDSAESCYNVTQNNPVNSQQSLC